jgi:hypothetical protein
MTQTGAIKQASDLRAHFRQELSEALSALRIEATVDTEAYVVQLLDGFVRPDERRQRTLGFDRPAALLLGDALEEDGAQRIAGLRELGDACLYHCGFFEAKLARRGMKAAYYERMGRIAYGSLHELLEVRRPGDVFAGIFGELERLFEPLVRALRHIAAPVLLRSPEADAVLERWTQARALVSAPLFKLS